MTDDEYLAIKTKVEKEFPIRCQLAVLAGRPKINPKNYKAMEDFTTTVAELFLEVAMNQPQNIEQAIVLVKSIQ